MMHLILGIITATAQDDSFLQPSIFLGDLKPIAESGIYRTEDIGTTVDRAPVPGIEGDQTPMLRQRFVRVEDVHRRRGEFRTILFPSGPGRRLPRLKVGEEYLILVAPTANRKLSAPLGTWDEWKSESYEWIAHEGDDAIAVAWLSAPPNGIPQGSTPELRLTKAIASRLIFGKPSEIRNILAFFRSARFPGAKEFLARNGSPPNEFHAYLLALRNQLGPENRSRLNYVLNDWKVQGSARWYIDAVAELSADAFAFSDQAEIEPVQFWEHPDPITGKGRTFELPTGNEWVTRVLGSKNTKVSAFLLSQLGGIRADGAHERMLASLLDRKDEELQYWICWHFSVIENQQSKGPVRNVRYTPAHQVDYPGLQDVVQYWKQYWQEGSVEARQ